MRVHYSLLTLLAAATIEVVGEPSPGCGKAPTKLKNGMNSINMNGVARSFILHLPENYDNKNPYRTVFAFHATGGTANNTAKSYYGLLSRAGNTSILVSPQGQSPVAADGKVSGIAGNLAKGITGWWRTGGKYGEEDLNFVDTMIEAIDADLCTESRQRFSTGFSFGGVMSYSLACLRPEKFRAVSVQSGCGFDQVIGGMSLNNKGKESGAAKPPGACKKTDIVSSSYMGTDPGTLLDPLILGDKKPNPTMVCGTKAVPYMAFMGTCDGWIQYGRQSRDDFLRNNGCKPEVALFPVEGSKQRVQTKYECAPDTPVVWTEFDGGHMETREAQQDTWEFFSQFK
jgi:poly(3-hydroxybutyrate) depolymerase